MTALHRSIVPDAGSLTDRATVAVRVPFAALILAMLPAVLDQTVLATALPTIASDLGRLADVSWLVTAYVVAATAATPLWGRLGDRLGRKRLLQVALGWFIAASALCGLAQTLTQLIVLRAVQGLAAGGLMALAMASVGDLVAPRRRSRYQGYIAATFAITTVIGPLIGGLLVDHASWRWVFYVNVPLGLAALAVLALRFPAADADPGRQRLDVAGAALVAAATTALMLACIWGGARYAWGSPQIVGLGGGALVLGAALVVRERRAQDPILPLALLATRPVAVASAALFLGTAALFSVTVFVPLFLQAVTGATPTQAGLLLAPMMLGTTVSTVVSGRIIARTGRYRRFPIAGLGTMAAALALLAALAPQRSAVATGAAIALFGAGFGMVTQVLVVAVQNTVERRQLGTATATTSFFRALGGAVGAALLGAAFAAQSGRGAGGVHGLVAGVQLVFLIAAGLAVAGLAVASRMPEAEDRAGDGGG